jgi:hypothetical protein
MGEPALEFLVGYLQKGELLLNSAILEIAHLHPADLGLFGFYSEQEIAEALVAFFEPIKFSIYLTAIAAMPTPTARPVVLAQNATVSPPQQPVSPLARLIEQRA